LVLPSLVASGTERRISFVYRHLVRRYPGEYLLVVSRELYPVLNRGGFGLDELPDVFVLGPRAATHFKSEAHASIPVNLGRLGTLFRYRRELQKLIEREGVTLLHPYLELVPFLGLFPISNIPRVVPIVDHLPKYFDRRSLDCRVLLRAISSSVRVDCLYRWIALQLEDLGVDPGLTANPAWNTANHDAFHPETKEMAVSYAARTIDWKNPLLMIKVMGRVFDRHPEVHFSVLGKGKMGSELAAQVSARGWQGKVRVGYLEDPSAVVNRSLIHVSLDRYDNFTNQSMLEGMAAGCAIVASRVGETSLVVTPDVGLLAGLNADEIADAILRLLENPAWAQELGRIGRQKVMTNHHVDHYIDYLRLVHDLSRPGPIVDGVRISAESP